MQDRPSQGRRMDAVAGSKVLGCEATVSDCVLSLLCSRQATLQALKLCVTHWRPERGSPQADARPRAPAAKGSLRGGQ